MFLLTFEEGMNSKIDCFMLMLSRCLSFFLALPPVKFCLQGKRGERYTRNPETNLMHRICALTEWIRSPCTGLIDNLVEMQINLLLGSPLN